MSYPMLPLALAFTVLGACAAEQPASNTPASLADEKRLVTGLWTMRYLVDGETTVAEFRTDGQLLLHSFNCLQSRREPTSGLPYSVSDDGQFISLGQSRWKVRAFSADAMELAGTGANTMWYDLVRTDNIDKACERYPELAAERLRQTPYQQGDFAAAPVIPAHPDLQRYVGQWTSYKSVELQIARDANGQFVLSTPTVDGWHSLYNDVHWEGDQLHFQKYSYSDQPQQYGAPMHKSLQPNILRAMPDGSLRQSFVLNGDPYVSILKRIDKPFPQ